MRIRSGLELGARGLGVKTVRTFGPSQQRFSHTKKHVQNSESKCCSGVSQFRVVFRTWQLAYHRIAPPARCGSRGVLATFRALHNRRVSNEYTTSKCAPPRKSLKSMSVSRFSSVSRPTKLLGSPGCRLTCPTIACDTHRLSNHNNKQRMQHRSSTRTSSIDMRIGRCVPKTFESICFFRSCWFFSVCKTGQHCACSAWFELIPALG